MFALADDVTAARTAAPIRIFGLKGSTEAFRSVSYARGIQFANEKRSAPKSYKIRLNLRRNHFYGTTYAAKTDSVGCPTQPAILSMPHFNFHKPSSTQEENLFFRSAVGCETAPASSPEYLTGFLVNAFGFSPSTWANIGFVATASLGALFCAFYFFNGADVVRTAVVWPHEFLYPGPDSTDWFDASRLNAVGKQRNVSPFERRFFEPDLARPGVGPGATNAGGLVVSRPAPDPFSNAGSNMMDGLNSLPRGGDAISQSFYHAAVSMASKAVGHATKPAVGSTGRPGSAAQQSNGARTGGALKTTYSIARSTNVTRPMMQMRQDTIGQFRANVSAIHAQSQMMMGGARGGLGGVGAGNAGLAGATRMAGHQGGGRR